MRDMNIRRTYHKKNSFNFSKELCLRILKLRKNGLTFSSIYNKLNLSEYYPNSISAYIYRFYKDCKGYGIDVLSVYKKRYYVITKEKYEEMCNDLKNNPKKYTMRQFLEKHHVPMNQLGTVYNKTYLHGLSIRLYDLKENFIYVKSREHSRDNIMKCNIDRTKKCMKKFKNMTIRLECDDSFTDFYKEFGYKSPDSCKRVYEQFRKKFG